MKNFIRRLWFCFWDRFTNVSYDLGNWLNVLSNFLMLLLGQYVYKIRGCFGIGGEIFIPVVICIIVFLFKYVGSQKHAEKEAIPVPRKRFTEVHNDGEVTIEYNKMEELILYVADVEDYLENKGLM